MVVAMLALFVALSGVACGGGGGRHPSVPQTVAVDEHDFVIALQGGETQLKAGSYDFEVRNTGGKIGHDLTIDGPGVSARTPIFFPGQTQSLKVTLKPGKYDFYCSVDGHRQAGMNLVVTVS